MLKSRPNDPLILLNAADAAVLAGDKSYADKALQQFMALKNYDPQSLTEAARIYRSMGQSAQATQLLRKAVDIEQTESQRSLIARGGSTSVAANPFADRGQRNQLGRTSIDEIPLPAKTLLQPGPALAAANPFAAPGTLNTGVEQTSSARRALDDLLQERSGYVTQGGDHSQ